MSITIRKATVTDSRTVAARIYDSGCRGLNIGHLRAFVEQANLALLKDETRVQLRDELQAFSSLRNVEINASEQQTNTVPVGEATGVEE